MKKTILILFLTFLVTGNFLASSQWASSMNEGKNGTFSIGNNSFLLNGKPFVIRAGELHYTRIPRQYWEQRIQMCKAMGMNTICIYLFWNFHEQVQGKFDFTGQADVAEFVKLIQKNGMYCIVRPGPYVCAEWDMGGLPWWLLKKADLKVRTLSDDFYMSGAVKFLNEAGRQLAPLQIQNGGNIIMVQVENEYGAFGSDGKYMAAMRDAVRAAGFDKVQLVRCDWSSTFTKYPLEGVSIALNFGSGSNIDDQFSKFKQQYPDAPLMCGEYWSGWFDYWGRPHETRTVSSLIGSLSDMMDRKISFSLYMAHGGTTFGQWGGANSPPFGANVASYDYNAPIDESGHPTDKFFAVRELLKKHLNEGEVVPDIPPANHQIQVPVFELTKTANLFENLPKARLSENIKPMEMFDQGWGSILYRTKIGSTNSKSRLVITELHDWAMIYIDGRFVGRLDRRLGENAVELPPVEKESRLDILVDAIGRVNFGETILDRKGITRKVEQITLKDTVLLGNWEVFNIPVDYKFQNQVVFKNAKADGPAWYKGSFNLSDLGDTYLDMSKWGKGMVWVNGNNLGRFWRIGPQQTLYLPGCWLKKGDNEILVFDLEGTSTAKIEGISHPILDVIDPNSGMLHRGENENLKLAGETPVFSGSFSKEKGWQNITFSSQAEGRYFCLEAVNSQNNEDSFTTIAEIEILGPDGKPFPKTDWKIRYADSEEVTSETNNSADRVFDKQESTFWHTRWSGGIVKHPHQIVIDLGATVKISGFRYLPRNDNSENGLIKDFRIYIKKGSFRFR
jgi:beta-galactosidase